MICQIGNKKYFGSDLLESESFCNIMLEGSNFLALFLLGAGNFC